ncbi:MAG: hypothetical protein WCF57_22290 [Pyrinomonadaceae bacterium]
MNPAIKLSLLASGLFLLAGMLLGVLKYRRIMTSPEHRAPVYVDIAHRASFLYSFASLVIARLLEYSPFTVTAQVLIAAVPLFYFAVTIVEYTVLGLRNRTRNQFSERNFITTWGMYTLIVGEIGGLSAILWGFISTQLIGS